MMFPAYFHTTMWNAAPSYTELYYNTIQQCTELYYSLLYCSILRCSVLYYTTLYHSTVYCSVLWYDVLYCTTLQRTKLDSALHTDVYFLHCHLLEGCNKNRTPLFHIDYFFFSTTHLDLPSRNPHFHYIKGCYLFSLLLWLKLHVGMRLIKVSIFQGKPSAVRFLLQS